MLSSRKSQNNLNQKGIALLQVLIFSVILGIMGVAYITLTDQQNKTLDSSKLQFELTEFTDKVRMALSSSKACMDTFGGQPYGAGFSVSDIKRSYKAPGNPTPVTSVLATSGTNVSPHLKLKEIRLKNVTIGNTKGIVEITLEKIANASIGGQIYKREIQVKVLDSNGMGNITDCFSTGSNIEDPAELCNSLGGTLSTAGFCDGLVTIDPNPVTCTKFAKRSLTQDSMKRLKIVCDDCVAVDKFDHWTCGNYPGKNKYSNLCYYRKVCQSSISDTMRPALWDGVKGPIAASGGDTPTHSGCVSAHKLCPLEPAGMAENVVNP